MAARNISITPELLAHAQHRVDSGKFETVSEYIRSLVRADLERAEAERHLMALLEEGERSGFGVEMTPDELYEHLQARRTRRREATQQRKAG